MKPLGPNEGGNRHRHPDCRFCDESQRLNLGIMAENRALKAKLAPVEGQSRLHKQQRDELLAALKPVAELADRLDAKGHLAPDPHFSCDEDLSFPSDVELSVADLKRARRAAERVRKGQ